MKSEPDSSLAGRTALVTGAGDPAGIGFASATRLAQRLAEMRGAAMKMGQLLSMESADFLPAEFAQALAILRDAGHTMPDSQLRGVLGREYGKGWEERFRDFDHEPIASASMARRRWSNSPRPTTMVDSPGQARP